MSYRTIRPVIGPACAKYPIDGCEHAFHDAQTADKLERGVLAICKGTQSPAARVDTPHAPNR